MVDRLRVGVVGCGLIAQIAHLPYLSELSHLFEISALCARTPGRLDRLYRRYNVPKKYLDYRELVEQDLDAVLVLTRDHAEIAIAAAKQGKHVFVEKPIAFNLEQTDEMVECAAERGVKLMVGYMKRYDPGFQRAQEIFREMKGERLIRVHSSVGLPSRMVEEMYDLVPGPEMKEEEHAAAKAREDAACLQAIGEDKKPYLHAYSLLLQLWSHDINILRGAFGDPQQIRYVEIRAGKPVPPRPAPLQILSILDFGPEMACTWASRAFMVNEAWDEELALFGTEKTVRVRFPFMYLKNTPALVHVEETVRGARVRQEIVSDYDEAYKRELAHFYDCVVNDEEPLTNGRDARKDMELAIRMINQASLNISEEENRHAQTV